MSSTDKRYATSIDLPTEDVFRNLQNACHFAVDIGMTNVYKLYTSESLKILNSAIDNINHQHMTPPEKPKFKQCMIQLGTFTNCDGIDPFTYISINVGTCCMKYKHAQLSYQDNCKLLDQGNIFDSTMYSITDS